eukprot:COSAG02_NODE_4138_length_5725_cov_20.138287_3_plen_113_part_00
MPPKREPKNIERFLAATTPTVRSSRLAELWTFYDVPYGVEVPYYEGTGPVGSAKPLLPSRLRTDCAASPCDNAILCVTAHALPPTACANILRPVPQRNATLEEEEEEARCSL